MPPLLLLWLWFAPLAAQAVSGSWVADASGVTLTMGGVREPSPSLRAAHLPTAAARITRVSWRYQLLSAAPAGLQVQLCTTARCLSLEGGSGHSTAFNGIPADSEFHLVYSVQSRGGLHPPLRVIANQVIVSYE